MSVTRSYIVEECVERGLLLYARGINMRIGQKE